MSELEPDSDVLTPEEFAIEVVEEIYRSRGLPTPEDWAVDANVTIGQWKAAIVKMFQDE